MAGYSVKKLATPSKDSAYIEAFFTKKGENLYCILPRYVSQFRLRDRVLLNRAEVTILGSKAKVGFKVENRDTLIDLSKLQPGDIAGELVVLKIAPSAR